MSDTRDLIALLLDRSVRHGSFTLASGAQSSYYIDARLTTMSASGLALIGRLGLHAIREAGWSPKAVGGLTMGADPVAYAVARATVEEPPVIEAFSVRKAAKGHGTGKRIEGNFRSGDAVVVVEDVITSGGSARQAIETVEAEGGTVQGILAVVDREEGGRQLLERLGYPVVALATVRDLGLSK